MVTVSPQCSSREYANMQPSTACYPHNAPHSEKFAQCTSRRYVCLGVCLSICVQDNSKNNRSIHLKLEHIVVYENSSYEFDIGHCAIKVKVMA